MKKLVSLMLVLLMCFSLAACGDSGKQSGGDALTKLYNELATLYNDASAAAVENGWENDDQTLLELQAVAATLSGIGAGIEDPSLMEGADTDELVAQLEQLKPAMEELIKRVSVPYDG